MAEEMQNAEPGQIKSTEAQAKTKGMILGPSGIPLRIDHGRVLEEALRAGESYERMLQRDVAGLMAEAAAEGHLSATVQDAITSESVILLSVSREEFERLSAKANEVLAETAFALERIAKDQQAIEQLKMETRAMLARLGAA